MTVHEIFWVQRCILSYYWILSFPIESKLDIYAGERCRRALIFKDVLENILKSLLLFIALSGNTLDQLSITVMNAMKRLQRRNNEPYIKSKSIMVENIRLQDKRTVPTKRFIPKTVGR